MTAQRVAPARCSSGRAAGDGQPAPSGTPLATFALLAVGMAIFGSGTPVSKLVTDAFPVFLGSGLRLVLATAFLVPVAVVLHGRAADGLGAFRHLGRRDWLLLAGIALGGVVLFSVLMLLGMREIPGAVAGVVMGTTPAVTAFGSVVVLREHLDRWTAVGIGAAVAGVVTVNITGAAATGSGDRLWLGTLLVFGAVCGEASYTLLGKSLTATVKPVAVAALAGALATAMFLPLAAWQAVGFDWSQPDGTDWLALVWWGVGTMGLGSWIWYLGVSRTAGTTASGFMGVMPVSALVLSYVLLGESFVWVHLVGMACVLVGLAAIVHASRRQER